MLIKKNQASCYCQTVNYCQDSKLLSDSKGAVLFKKESAPPSMLIKKNQASCYCQTVNYCQDR